MTRVRIAWPLIANEIRRRLAFSVLRQRKHIHTRETTARRAVELFADSLSCKLVSAALRRLARAGLVLEAPRRGRNRTWRRA
jgi:DNA-binding transcriptional ArsR family regulator